MAKGKSTWKYNKLLTARRNYFNIGGILNNIAGNPDESGNITTGLFKGMSSKVSGGLSALGPAVGGAIGGAISGGLDSKAGNVISGLGDIASAIPGPWGAIAGAGLKIIGGITNAAFGSKLNSENIAAVEGATSRANNFTSNAATFDELTSNMASAADVSNFSDSYIGKDGWLANDAKNKAASLRKQAELANKRQALALLSNAENIQSDTLRNLEANYSAFGGPIDFDGGAIGYDFMNQYLDIKKQSAMGQNNSLTSLPNSFAGGGKIHIKEANKGKFTDYCGGNVTAECIARGKRSSSSAVRKRATFAANARKWHHAFGGDLLTHGANFDTGLTIVGNGGTHEDNPYEGVPMGVDKEGTPNLVEEGETIFNDYVFSKRLMVPKSFKNKYKLGKKDISFADASKKLAKESEERPNDPISIAGLQALLSDLANTQEQLKAETESGSYAYGGKIKKFDGKSQSTQRLNTYKNYEQLDKDTDFYTPEYIQFWDYMGNSDNKDEANKWLDRINSNEFGTIGGNTFTLDDIQRLSRDYKKGPVHNAYAQAAAEFARNNRRTLASAEEKFGALPELIKNNYAEKPGNIPLTLRGSRSSDDSGDDSGDDKSPILPTWLRYTPAVASGIMSITDVLDLTNKPDYSEADMVLDAARGTGSYNPIGFNPIGNYLTYTPFDREFYINQMNAQAGATRRAILQNAGLNRGAGMAALLASDYGAQGQLGQLARQAEEYNLAQRQKVEEFNRGTDMFNTEGALKADMANQEAALKVRDSYLRGTLSAAELRQRERQQSAAAKSANLSNFINSLGDIGRENFQMNMINTNPALYYYLSGRGETGYKASKGGLLTRKKKRK